MPRSSYLGPPGAETNVAVGPGGRSPRALSAGGHANAAASLITTVDDYAGFLQYLLANPALLDTLLTPEVNVDAGAEGSIAWGLGWGVFERADGTRLGFHWGDNYQFKAFVAIDPAAGRAVVFFANGFEGLRLVRVIVEPVVGGMQPVRDWLGYDDH